MKSPIVTAKFSRTRAGWSTETAAPISFHAAHEFTGCPDFQLTGWRLALAVTAVAARRFEFQGKPPT